MIPTTLGHPAEIIEEGDANEIATMLGFLFYNLSLQYAERNESPLQFARRQAQFETLVDMMGRKKLRELVKECLGNIMDPDETHGHETAAQAREAWDAYEQYGCN